MSLVLLLALLGPSPFIVPPPQGQASSGVSAQGSGTCVGTDSVLADNNGYVGCQKLSDVAPQGLLIRPQPAFPGGTQTAANLILAGGQDETKIAIDGADPTSTCADDNDTVTVTVIDSNGTSTATMLTEGTHWTAAASVATTCASLAAAVEALAGVGASCTSPNVLITLDPSTASVALVESTIACTTVDAGTAGNVAVASGRLRVGLASNNPALTANGSSLHIFQGTGSSYANAYGTFVGQGTRAQVVEGSGAFVAASGGQFCWSDSASSGGGGNLDTCFARSAAGVARITNGSTGNGKLHSLSLTSSTIAADDTTPDVSGGSVFVTSANTGATAITDLDSPTAGQVVTICGGSATNSSTIADSGNFNLSAAFTASVDDCLTLYVQADNDYVELSRVNN
jgi:hypothetical protein